MNRYLLLQYTIDFTPKDLQNIITIGNIYEWLDFLLENKIFEINDIFNYLDAKHKQIRNNLINYE